MCLNLCTCIETGTHTHMCVCRPCRVSVSQFCYLNKAHHTSIYLGMCDKAYWGVLVKQFLQNKLCLPKLLLARRSLNWSGCRGELRPRRRSLERRRVRRKHQGNNNCRYAHVRTSLLNLCMLKKQKRTTRVTKDRDSSLFTFIFHNFFSCNFYLYTFISLHLTAADLSDLPGLGAASVLDHLPSILLY